MKILVTGSAGFIGSYTVRRLLSNGHDVVGIDNFDDFYNRKAKEFNLDLINHMVSKDLVYMSKSEIEPIYSKLMTFSDKSDSRVGEYEFIETDLLDLKAITSLFERFEFDGVIHLAAKAGVPHSLKKPVEYAQVNIVGTTNLLEMCAQRNIKNFVFASSSSVYGHCIDVPFDEGMDVDSPISPYAATKRMGEIMNYTYHKLYDIKISNLRFFTVYGPLQRPYGMAIQKFIKQTYLGKPMTIYGDGSMGRDYTYIDDITDGVLKALENNNGYEIYNIGNKDSVTLDRLSKVIIKEIGEGSIENLECPPTEVPVTFADISKAKNELGYEPKISIDEGVKRQIEVFKLMPNWYKTLDE